MIEIIASASFFFSPAQIGRVTSCDRFLSLRITSTESEKYFSCIKKVDPLGISMVKRCRSNLKAPFWAASKGDRKAFTNCLKGIVSIPFESSLIAYTREPETYGRCVSQETGQIVRCTDTCTMDDANGRRREIPCKDECYELDEKGNPELDRNGRKIYFPCPPREYK